MPGDCTVMTVSVHASAATHGRGDRGAAERAGADSRGFLPGRDVRGDCVGHVHHRGGRQHAAGGPHQAHQPRDLHPVRVPQGEREAPHCKATTRKYEKWQMPCATALLRRQDKLDSFSHRCRARARMGSRQALWRRLSCWTTTGTALHDHPE